MTTKVRVLVWLCDVCLCTAIRLAKWGGFDFTIENVDRKEEA